MNFPRYPKYKDSGVEWLGEVPEHWDLSRTKNLFSLKKRPPEHGDGIITAFRDGEVTLRSNRRTDGFTNAIQEHGYQRIHPDDLVIHAMDAFAGAIGVSDSYGKSTPVYSVCEAKYKTINPHYYGRLMRHMALSGYINSLSKGIRERSTEFRWKEAANVTLAYPTLAEQTSIVSFLNRETGKIDALVDEQRRLIELLKEKRQAVISDAVTKGLDPDVAMKDSGVEWLGEVPEHWDVMRLRHAINLNPSKSETASLDPDTRVSFLPMEAVGVDGSLSLNQTRPISEVKSGYTYFRNGDVTVAKITPCFENGKGALMQGLETGIGFGTTELIVARPRPDRITSQFLSFLFRTAEFRRLGEGEMYGAGGQKRVPDSFVREFYTAIPPLNEQTTIVSFVDREIGKFDVLTVEADSVISLLQERRTALISAAVTGKIDVRNHSPITEGVPA